MTVMLAAHPSFVASNLGSHYLSRIESQSPDTTIDSRKIVNLVFVASDRRINPEIDQGPGCRMRLRQLGCD